MWSALATSVDRRPKLIATTFLSDYNLALILNTVHCRLDDFMRMTAVYNV